MEGKMVGYSTILMLAVTGCYTITSLSDKYAAAKARFSGNEFTFLMCSSMSVFLLLTLPFQKISFDFSSAAFVGVLLVALCKLLEFKMSALVLRELSAFELKAWLGITLFVSYFTDVLFGDVLKSTKLACLCLTALGLVFIVKSDKADTTDYKKIVLPLALYISAKYGYGLAIRSFSDHASSVMLLLPALFLIAVGMFPFVDMKIYREKAAGTRNVVLARIPNTAGMIMENAVIAISLASYSLIQPMILVTLFLISALRHECGSTRSIMGSLMCIAGTIMFQLMK